MAKKTCVQFFYVRFVTASWINGSKSFSKNTLSQFQNNFHCQRQHLFSIVPRRADHGLDTDAKLNRKSPCSFRLHVSTYRKFYRSVCSIFAMRLFAICKSLVLISAFSALHFHCKSGCIFFSSESLQQESASLELCSPRAQSRRQRIQLS
jgi:hypothetical protein